MPEETVKAFTDSIKERLSNKFLGAFVVSWCLVNWKIAFIALASFEKHEDKIWEIYQVVTNINTSLFTPLLLTLIWVAVIPWLSNVVEWYQTWVGMVRHNLKVKIEKGKIISADIHAALGEHCNKLMAEIQEIGGQYATRESKMIEDHTKSLAIHNDLSTAKDKHLEELKKEIASLNLAKMDYTALQSAAYNDWRNVMPHLRDKVILHSISRMNHLNSANEVYAALLNPSTLHDQGCDELQKEKFIIRFMQQNFISEKGLHFLANYKPDGTNMPIASNESVNSDSPNQ